MKTITCQSVAFTKSTPNHFYRCLKSVAMVTRIWFCLLYLAQSLCVPSYISVCLCVCLYVHLCLQSLLLLHCHCSHYHYIVYIYASLYLSVSAYISAIASLCLCISVGLCLCVSSVILYLSLFSSVIQFSLHVAYAHATHTILQYISYCVSASASVAVLLLRCVLVQATVMLFGFCSRPRLRCHQSPSRLTHDMLDWTKN